MDPSIPPEDGSCPFLESRDAEIFAIFKTLSAHGEKDKMRMELVCGKLKSRIENRSSWEGENRVKLGQIDGQVDINGFKFSFEKASSALGKLLDRITVEKLVLDKVSDVADKDRLGICDAIAKHRNFINLKYIQFMEFSLESTVIMSTLIGCGLEQLTEIRCGESLTGPTFHRIGTVDLHFYPFLLCCPNLKIFIYWTKDILPVWEFLLPALTNCPNITTLQINSVKQEVNLTHQQAIEFAKTCSSNFHKLTYVDFSPGIETLEPFEYLNVLDENHSLFSNIIKFGIALEPEIPSHRECLKTVFRRFPKLKMFDTRSTGRFSTETIVEAIGNIFETYGTGKSDIYEFKLIVLAQNPGELIWQLVKKKWSDDQFAEIEGKNGLYKCIKNKVRITLDLDRP